MGLSVQACGRGPRVVLAHGFTQSRESWAAVSEALRDRHEVVAVDMPGHGGSAEVRADVVEGARLLGEAGGRAAYVGYSMGGRHCLRLALDRPDLVESLVLVGATAGIEDLPQRRDRRAADDALAAELDPPGGAGGLDPPGSAGERARLEAFLRRWVAQPLFAGISPEAAGLRQRLERGTCTGLAASLRLAGTATQEPLWDRLGTLQAPLLFVGGELDLRFVALGRRIVEAAGGPATLVVLPGVGHAAHLQAPGAFAGILARFLGGEPLQGDTGSLPQGGKPLQGDTGSLPQGGQLPQGGEPPQGDTGSLPRGDPHTASPTARASP